MLDEDVYSTKRFVEHTEENLSVYSIEFARIILTACSEIDTICRILCKHIDSSSSFEDPDGRGGNIRSYSELILDKYPKIVECEIESLTLRNKIKPWNEWVRGSDYRSPHWWSDYQYIKHFRHIHFNKATLENAISAVAALLTLLMYLQKINFGYTRGLSCESSKCFCSNALVDFDRNEIHTYRCKQLLDFR